MEAIQASLGQLVPQVNGGAEKWDWECKQSNGAASRNERLIGVDEASIPEEFKLYTGARQSPVAIDSTVALPWMFPPLQLHHHWDKKASIKLTNTGHSVEMSFVADDGCCPSSAMPYLIGGPLAAEYEFVQMHFHWGNENHVGCEHIIDNKKYAMEAHLVHYNRSYGSVAEAFKHPDGLAVIGIFLQVGESENEGLSMLSSRVKDVCDEKGKCALVNPCDAAPLFWVKGVVEAHFAKSATGRGGYYTYLGSLTTPKYDENVTWIVFPEPSPISKRQIEEFRQLMSPAGRVKENFRPCQPIADRNIFIAD
ncbi:carbonic anhydrase 2-like isoform X2 [Ischnura elegans]|uniref:carbonic anhydrase 2-like isoform X2 n=1 Tax=Ischnura elegans TaxID=197161 RepID=UPI001ED8A647|nr:carbonic anhydrase 2-like isoform X2 [Ischnura elegans]